MAPHGLIATITEMTGYGLHRLGVSPQEIALIARGLRSR